jgi:hypothetical protein
MPALRRDGREQQKILWRLWNAAALAVHGMRRQ